MTTFLSVVAGIAGLIGLLYLVTGPAFVGLIWWVLALISLVSIPVLNYLKRIARASEKIAGDA